MDYDDKSSPDNVTGTNSNNLSGKIKMSLFRIQSDEELHEKVNGKVFNFTFGWSVDDGVIWIAEDQRFPEAQQNEFHSKHLTSIGGITC